MKTIILSDAAYDELRRALAVEQVPTPRPTPDPTPTLPVPPPILGGDWRSGAQARGAAQNYEPVTLYEWDWSLDTAHIEFSTAQARGVIVVAFVPTAPRNNARAMLDAIGYPVTQGNQLTLSLSSLPVDFGVTGPALSVSTAPSATYIIGDVVKPWAGPATDVGLEPGLRYFLNVTGRDSYDPSDSRGGGIRIHLRKPSGH